MTIDEVNRILEQGRLQVEATSCTFYVRDPFWPDALRLVAMPGVKLIEPMYGFNFPRSAKSTPGQGDTQAFTVRITKEERLDASAPKRLAIERLDPERRRLFGNFVEREAVVCSAEILRTLEGQIEALLFVNFDREKQFDARLKGILNGMLDEVTTELPSLRNELEQSEAEELVQVVRILQPALDVVSTRQEEWKSFLEGYFHSLLKVSLAATSVEPGRGLGTIHLYDEETSTLRLAAMEGEIKHSERAQSVWARSGHGIISWVAIRQNPLLISDLGNSEFGKIHIGLNESVRSEVAIPMMAGERLLGVLNLESFERDAFSAGCVRSLWFAANRAAVAFELSEQVRINSDLKTLSDGLMELWRHWIEDGGTDSFLDELASLAATHVDADRCGIWRYNKDADCFEDFGLSYRAPMPTPPRGDGWSSIIRRSKRPIWIYSIGKRDAFRVWYWVPNFWTIEPPTSRSVPDELSAGVVKEGVQALLGIPILLHDECVGVAWLEYQRDSPKVPSCRRDAARTWICFASRTVYGIDGTSVASCRTKVHPGDCRATRNALHCPGTPAS
jgi:GAF domain-containing protein